MDAEILLLVGQDGLRRSDYTSKPTIVAFTNRGKLEGLRRLKLLGQVIQLLVDVKYMIVILSQNGLELTSKQNKKESGCRPHSPTENMGTENR